VRPAPTRAGRLHVPEPDRRRGPLNEAAERALHSGHKETVIYPVIFRVGTFEVTSFGVMVGVGALVGIWLFMRELAFARISPSAVDAALVGVIGGLAGAKMLWVFEHLGEEPVWTLILSRGGMSWFGGFAGGLGAGVWMLRRRHVSVIAALSAATPALAVGHAIGRVGCFLVGDDYGRPSNLPWAVAFPEGLPPTLTPVHPTQIYEAVTLLPLAWLLIRWRRQRRPDTAILALYLAGAGAIRFIIEFLRVNVRVLGGLSVAHLAALAICAIGIGLLLSKRASLPATRS
jgi:phosphatidylglycerol:prolipoprotein diacylglycerol transferase